VNFEAIRRAVRLKGLTSATAVPEASSGRLEEASIRPARLTEGKALRTIAFGPPEDWPETVAYLDTTLGDHRLRRVSALVRGGVGGGSTRAPRP
jgi:hypothetical protein